MLFNVKPGSYVYILFVKTFCSLHSKTSLGTFFHTRKIVSCIALKPSQFNIGNLFEYNLFYLTMDRTLSMLPIRVRVAVGMKGYSTFTNSPRREPRYRMVYCHIWDTRYVGWPTSLERWRGVFSSPSRLGCQICEINIYFFCSVYYIEYIQLKNYEWEILFYQFHVSDNWQYKSFYVVFIFIVRAKATGDLYSLSCQILLIYAFMQNRVWY